MENLTIVIPAYNEPYLNKTVKDILVKSSAKIFVNIDGDMPEKLIKDGRVEYHHSPEPIGMRAGINLGIKKTKSKYIMKVDAHCLFAKDFDKVLKRDCKKNWLMIPRRYSLHAEDWKRGGGKYKDYHFIHKPVWGRYGWNMVPQVWYKSNDKEIDDVMTMQGSCWFAERKFYNKVVGELDTERYGGFAGDQLEIGMKYWTRGGRMKVNKKTWYAHLFKNAKYYKKHKAIRKYKIDRKVFRGYEKAMIDWKEDVIKLVDKFKPVPTW